MRSLVLHTIQIVLGKLLIHAHETINLCRIHPCEPVTTATFYTLFTIIPAVLLIVSRFHIILQVAF